MTATGSSASRRKGIPVRVTFRWENGHTYEVGIEDYQIEKIIDSMKDAMLVNTIASRL